MRQLYTFLVLMAFIVLPAQGQHEATPYREIPLTSMEAFQQTADNWQIVGRVRANRGEAQHIGDEAGTGVLMNNPSEEVRGHLFTRWEHADMELDVEVMMPAGSNSGIYFQGRYEIQLFDSWGKVEPADSDMGGIYQRWDDSRPEGQQGYEGHAPTVNVARAPGLWQHLNVVFQAPRFDASGNKVSPAKFVKVTLNGVVLHEDVTLTGPTRAAAFEDSEAARGPLMIQGDHGPVAFRNFKYRLYDTAPVRVTDLVYNYYEGRFNHEMPDVTQLETELELVKSEEVEEISSELATAERMFALQFTGNLEVPASGEYIFEVTQTSRFRLEIDGETILGDNSGEEVNKVGEFPRRLATKNLSRGKHSFSLTYAKGLWHAVPTALGWHVTGPGQLRTLLTTSTSIPGDAFSAYKMTVEEEPIIQRSFVVHDGEKRTHGMSVGFPDGLHYNYDTGNGSLLHLWKGPFLDTSTMWYQRGEIQSGVPLGSLINRSGKTAVYVGDHNNSSANDYRFISYRVDDLGQPAFTYVVDGLEVTDAIVPAEEGRYFTRTLTVSGDTGSEPAWCMLAESDNIEQVQKGIYLVDDQRMYIEVEGNSELEVISVDGKMRLVAPLQLTDGVSEVSYHLVW